MIKFSVIVPVYNAEKYIDRCLDSIINQSYSNFELIVVNDGSNDNSLQIIKNYCEEYPNIILINQKNQGVSETRNNGLKLVTGDYIIFIDSDDYIDLKHLETISNVLNNCSADVIKYGYIDIFQDGSRRENKNVAFDSILGEEAFKKFIDNRIMFDSVGIYAYKKSFWDEFSFTFAKGKCHEDFGIIPLILVKAKSVVAIDYYGYYYYHSSNSITRNNNYQKTLQKCYDTLWHFDNLKTVVLNDECITQKTKKFFLSFIANAVLSKANDLENEDQDKYIVELKNRKICRFLLADTLSRATKRFILKINIKLYLRIFD